MAACRRDGISAAPTKREKRGLIFIKVKTSASLLACDLAELSRETRRCVEAGVDWLHFDVMDGRFVRQITFGSPVLKCLRSATKMFVDVHLMVDDPSEQIDMFADAGADLIDIHVESRCDTEKALRRIKELGLVPALAVKPATPIESVYGYLPLCGMVLVMTVEPGYGGQRFLPETAAKISALREYAGAHGFGGLEIEVDGGINVETARVAREAGASVLVAGTGLFGAKDMCAADKALKGIALE